MVLACSCSHIFESSSPAWNSVSQVARQSVPFSTCFQSLWRPGWKTSLKMLNWKGRTQTDRQTNLYVLFFISPHHLGHDNNTTLSYNNLHSIASVFFLSKSSSFIRLLQGQTSWRKKNGWILSNRVDSIPQRHILSIVFAPLHLKKIHVSIDFKYLTYSTYPLVFTLLHKNPSILLLFLFQLSSFFTIQF